MTDRERKFGEGEDADADSDDRSELSPPSMSEMAFKDRWQGGDLLGELRNRFGGYDINWTELEPLADDLPQLATRLAEATGLSKGDVMDRIKAAEGSIL